jgi:hypothetical protein
MGKTTTARQRVVVSTGWAGERLGRIALKLYDLDFNQSTLLFKSPMDSL